MKVKIGKVIEVFIPKEFKNNQELDVMDCTKIGFKIKVDNQIIEIIKEQDEFNCQIMKNDAVRITIQDISGHHFVDIERYNGDLDE